MKSQSRNYDKLPQWAQSEIRNLKSRVEGLEDKLGMRTRGVEEFSPIEGVEGMDRIPINGYDTIRFSITRNNYIEVKKARDSDYFEISSTEALLTISPSSNRLHVMTAPAWSGGDVFGWILKKMKEKD